MITVQLYWSTEIKLILVRSETLRNDQYIMIENQLLFFLWKCNSSPFFDTSFIYYFILVYSCITYSFILKIMLIILAPMLHHTSEIRTRCAGGVIDSGSEWDVGVPSSNYSEVDYIHIGPRLGLIDLTGGLTNSCDVAPFLGYFY